MDKILKKELGLNKKIRLLIVAGLTILLTASYLFCSHLYTSTKKTVRAQAIRSITNISQLNKDSVSRALDNRRILLQMISARISGRNIDDIDVILKELPDFMSSYNFANMGVVSPDGTLHMVNGLSIDLSGTSFFSSIWVNHFQVSESYPPYDQGEYMVNALSFPIFQNDEIQYVLVATYHSIHLTERMNLSSFEGKGYNFLVNKKGDVVIYPRYYEDEDYNALMKFIDDTPNIVPLTGTDNYFKYKNESYYSHFEALGINDWYLMTCAKESDVFADANSITRNAFLIVGALWFITIGAILSLCYSIYRSKRELRQSFFYDELLNIGNGNALSVIYKKLPKDVLSSMYLVVFDIDKFKEFNYIYGNEAGDQLLKYIVQVFQEVLPEVYLFRYVSDYFVTLDSCESREIFEEKSRRILDRIRKDIENGTVPPFELSIGARKIQPGEPLRRVYSDALIARDPIKGSHMFHYAFYDDEIRQRRMKHMEMESNLPGALRRGEFHVYYQPKYDLATGSIVGAEALARWIKADGTTINPDEFIPCFETSRQIGLLDNAMLKEVCRQMKKMQADGLELKPVSVNLSRVHLRDQDILPTIDAILRESGIDPSLLSFEITESALLEETIPLKAIVNHLHELGCCVDMDDYGVGASSLNSLASNRFDVVKLDKSFVDGIGQERVEDVIQTTIFLAKRWGLKVVAEGVETRRQAECLLEWGCSLAQGFYYSKPVPEEQYRSLLGRHSN